MDAHAQLLDEWRGRMCHPSFFCDGIIDETRWRAVTPRILLLLKEAYDSKPTSSGWNLREALRTNEETQKDERARKIPIRELRMWKCAAYWCHAIQHPDADGRLSESESRKGEFDEALLGSAILNIKKGGGKSQSNPHELQEIGRKFGDLILRQVNLINPDIIVCGGTWGFVKHLFPEHEGHDIHDRIYPCGKRLIVDFWHPAIQSGYELPYYAMLYLSQNWIQQWITGGAQ